MRNFALQIFMVLTLTACMTSKDEILGPPSTTTEAVLQEPTANTVYVREFIDRSGAESSMYDMTVRKGVAELAPRVKFLKNDRRVLYFYPRLTSQNNLEPAYAIEYPTYQQLHVKKAR
ncbi:hypothetical protein KFE26_21685 [Shewanella sp. M16]|uniref:hypothetical protein n=1 Tax=Shewanella TaxID=22 RepID=UPI001BB09E63|nr:hypothetical protein [Shewanella sp. M16]MBS0044871.1 hypothetical protein [Shewanella sp. M16]